jgi:hypothetical protein
MKPRVQSAALLLFNRDGLLFCVRELQSKPGIGKVVGTKDYSFPWETQETDERQLRTVHRLIVEEIDATDQVRFSLSVPNWIGSIRVHDTLANVYVAQYESGPKNMRGVHAGIEIEPLGWRTRKFLLERCRDGVPEVLKLWDEYQRACCRALSA